MELLKSLKGRKLSELRDCDIECSDGQRIGRLIDAVFKTSDDVELTKMVVGGSRFEELMERLKLRPDVDPVFEIELIESLSPDKIVLKTKKDELKSTHIHEDALASDEVRLSDLSKLQLVDVNGEAIGNIIDMKFEDELSFVIGDGPVIEWAEAIGLVRDVDYLVSKDYVTSITSDQVKLSKRKDELKLTFEKEVLKAADREPKAATVRSDTRDSTASLFFPVK